MLDTSTEPVLDHLTQLGAALFGVSTVLISLLSEHRQFLKAAVNLEARETSRMSLFCACTVQSHQPLIVLDTLQDARFCTDELVVGSPFLRFYAGAPLIGRDGFTLGSFCVLSDKPRAVFAEAERQLLERLAFLTVEALEQRLLPSRIAETETALREANDRYSLAVQATTDGIWDWDYARGTVFFSGRLRSILGFPEQDFTGDVEEWLGRLHPADAVAARANIEHLRTSLMPSFESEYRIRHEDGTWRWVHNRGTAVRDEQGRLLRMIGAVADVTTRRMHDNLTGLASRLSLLNALEQHTRNAQIGLGRFAVLALDLDQFRRVNDSLGRNCGDFLLRETGRRVQQWVGSRADVAARITADEFVVLLDDVADEAAAVARAAALLNTIEEPLNCEGHKVRLAASIGLLLSWEASLVPEDMLQDANAAMHTAKGRGGNQICVFSRSIRDLAVERLTLESELREALARDEVSLFYQPKISLLTGVLIGFEALMRWQHPRRGTVPPAVFIPIAEQSDLILEVGRWTLRESLRQLAAWRAAGLIGPEITMAVNLSAKQFRDDELLPNVERKLARFGLPPGCLALEVTEGSLISNVGEALEILKRLKQLGVGLDLDDFGTGYSSLAYLKRFPFDALKVDRSFVSDLTEGSDGQAIVEAIVALGRSLRLQVIAEGIETEEQAALLRDMGCEFAQGFHFARPLPAAEIQQRLLEHRLCNTASISKAEAQGGGTLSGPL